MKRKTALARATILLLLFFFISLFSFSQNNFKVSGKVIDETGKPVSGATVTVKGTSIATATNSDGSFVLIIPSGNAVLVVTSVGIVELEVGVNNRQEIAISTTSNSTSLQDVVVIGYGTQKRKNVTGAVSSFNASNLQERPILRVDQALVGQLAGVRVKQTTGTPGKGFSIQVRGSGSISGGNEPLYVIDGFPLTVNSSNVSNGSFSTGNPLDNINPNDIERIEVLKDAAAAAIYGSRASNGVVIITTKHGRSGKAKISFNIYGGYNETAKKLEMMNPQQWIDQATEVINATYVTTFKSVGATANDDMATRLSRAGGNNANYIPDPRWTMPGHPGLTFIDWQDEIERKGRIQNYEISASGGNDLVKYFISGNYGYQQGFVINTDYKTFSARANVEINASKKLKFGINIAPTYSVSHDPGVEGKDAIFHQALSLAPVQEDTAGIYPNTGKNFEYFWSSSSNSPYGKLTYNKGTNKRYRTLGTVFGEYQIIKGLSFRTSVNFDNTDNISTTYVPYTTVGRAQETMSASGVVTATTNPRIFNGSASLTVNTSGTYRSYRRQTFVNENTLTYNTVYKNDHSINVLAGLAYNSDRLDQSSISSSGGYKSASIQTLNDAVAVTGSTTSTQSVLISYFGRLQYGFREKYFFAGSIRRDGSSRFGVNNQFGTFPSVSLKWIITEENFMSGISLISDLKLRASYGVNGNDNLPNDYASIATIGSAGYVLGSPSPGAVVIGQTPNVLANPDLKWEKSQTYDFGLDFGFLKNRITGSFDYYDKFNTDLLLNVQVPAATGFTSYLTNVGSVRNIGQELELTTRNLVGKFKWTTDFNITHNTNKVEALAPGQNQIIIPNGFTVSDAILRVGAPINSIYVLKVLGFLTAKDIADHVPMYNTEQPGDFKIEDFDHDGKITESDKQIVGHPNPDYYYGITNTFRYEGFDLNILIQGQWGGSIYSQFGRSISRVGQGRSDNHPASYVDRWYSETNQGAGRFSKAYSTMNSPITAFTDWLYPSDYVRVRNITLGYDLKRLFKKNLVQDARLYLTLENFFGKDKYTNGLNPEATNTSISTNSAYPEAGDYGAMPLSKSFIVGLNITF